MCEGMKHDRVWGQEGELFIQGAPAHRPGLCTCESNRETGAIVHVGTKEKKSARKVSVHESYI